MATVNPAHNVRGALPDINPSRIKRKPPPTLDLAVRYPMPDPTDPFAPLEVLRNRTSSALLGQPSGPTNVQIFHQSNQSHQSVHALLTLTSSPPVEKANQRRRSQSVFVFPSPSSPVTRQVTPWAASIKPEPPIPKIIKDNDTNDSDSDTCVNHDHDHLMKPLPPRPRELSTCFARFRKQKKTGPPTELNRVRKISISPPVYSTAVWNAGAKGLVPLNSNNHLAPMLANSISLDTYHAMPNDIPLLKKLAYSNPHDMPRLSHSIIPPSVSAPTDTLQTRRRSIQVAPVDVTNSSSSYINIHTSPLKQTFPHSTPESTTPRPAPRSVSPFLRGPKTNKPAPPHTHKSSPTPTHQQPEWALPTPELLAAVSELPIIAESGVRIAFGSLFATQRVVVVFIRHFWCPLCQDYMSSLMSYARPEMLTPSSQDKGEKGQQVQLVVIGNGAYTLIAKYRRMFGLPFALYTDPTRAVYMALGMGSDKIAKGVEEKSCVRTLPSSEKIHAEKRNEGLHIPIEDVGYVKHGLIRGIAMVVARAVKVGMPMWENGGDIGQLGGEFVFGPGLTCSFAHRMQTSKGHAPIEVALNAAGIANGHSSSLKSSASLPITKIPQAKHRESSMVVHTSSTWGEGLDLRRTALSSRASIDVLRRGEDNVWIDQRHKNLERLKHKKHGGRGSASMNFIEGVGACSTPECPIRPL